MILDRVTITGADDSVQPGTIADLSKEFPFVEWGILFSQHGESPRFPSSGWVRSLWEWQAEQRMTLSAHLCGGWVRDLVCDGHPTFFEKHFATCAMWDRVQLNFHADKHALHHTLGQFMREYPKDYILQLDGVNDQHFKALRAECDNVYPLFDVSGGAGVLPDRWPAPMADYTGYAGGLGPENLAEQLRKIDAAAGNARVWVDMETRVRSRNNQQFDLTKVRECLEIAQPFVTLRRE
jgi:hypothetical protein